MHRDIYLVAAALLVCACAPGSAETAPDSVTARPLTAELEGMKRTVVQLRIAIEGTDKSAVAALVQYPIVFRTASGASQIKSESDFIARYDQVVTSRVVAALICQDLEKLDYSPTFGTVIGQREIVLALVTEGHREPVYRVISMQSKPWPIDKTRPDNSCFQNTVQKLDARAKSMRSGPRH